MTTAGDRITDLLARIVALQLELDTTSAAKPYFFYSQPGFPYWVNRVGAVTPISTSPDTYKFRVTVEMWYHAGQLTEGYEGLLEAALQVQIMDTLVYFLARPLLTSAAYPAAMVGLDSVALTITSRGIGKADHEQGQPVSTIFELAAPILVPVRGAV